ncbi:toll/interleukin-1 receptor domain-containing protein [Kineococcus sp. SYSU DK005]|uniref:toll/interleukin-1 receptor domain-containing protein n=1 Tax=Kineococcus sp. SYSU DK005 TaxID=3383126 RepID=UPI003D7C4B52
MKVFISWSGELARKIAEDLREWLPGVIQAADCYVSSRDTEAGVRWNHIIEAQLESSDFGIICLTPDNIEAPWLNFEAGALGKAVQGSHVVPLLYDMTPADINTPLKQFQAKQLTRDGVLEMVQTMNRVAERSLPNSTIEAVFDGLWPRLETKIGALNSSGGFTRRPKQRSDRELLEELVTAVRELQRTQRQPANTIGAARGDSRPRSAVGELNKSVENVGASLKFGKEGPIVFSKYPLNATQQRFIEAVAEASGLLPVEFESELPS